MFFLSTISISMLGYASDFEEEVGGVKLEYSGTKDCTCDKSSSENKLDRFETQFHVDESGRASPEVFYPFRWSPYAYSGIGYYSTETSYQGTIDNVEEGRVASTSKEQRWRIALLSLEARNGGFNYSVGAEIEQQEFENLEFGYIKFPDSLGGDWTAFENSIDIKVLRPTLKGELAYGGSNDTINARLTLFVFPQSTLSVNQDTRFKPIVNETGINEDESDQSLSWKAKVDFQVGLSQLIDLGFSAQYEKFSLDYSIKSLSQDADTLVFSFANASVSSEQTIYSWQVKMLFYSQIFGDIEPSLGVGQKTIEIDGVSESEKIVSIGLGKIF